MITSRIDTFLKRQEDHWDKLVNKTSAIITHHKNKHINNNNNNNNNNNDSSHYHHKNVDQNKNDDIAQQNKILTNVRRLMHRLDSSWTNIELELNQLNTLTTTTTTIDDKSDKSDEKCTLIMNQLQSMLIFVQDGIQLLKQPVNNNNSSNNKKNSRMSESGIASKQMISAMGQLQNWKLRIDSMNVNVKQKLLEYRANREEEWLLEQQLATTTTTTTIGEESSNEPKENFDDDSETRNEEVVENVENVGKKDEQPVVIKRRTFTAQQVGSEPLKNAITGGGGSSNRASVGSNSQKRASTLFHSRKIQGHLRKELLSKIAESDKKNEQSTTTTSSSKGENDSSNDKEKRQDEQYANMTQEELTGQVRELTGALKQRALEARDALLADDSLVDSASDLFNKNAERVKEENARLKQHNSDVRVGMLKTSVIIVFVLLASFLMFFLILLFPKR